VLVDDLLSAEAEVALAKSKSRQIPIGQLTDEQAASLPDEVKRLRDWAAQRYPLADVADDAQPCLDWLRSEYVQ
jgi:iron(III) transport system substrate-binding protein